MLGVMRYVSHQPYVAGSLPMHGNYHTSSLVCSKLSMVVLPWKILYPQTVIFLRRISPKQKKKKKKKTKPFCIILLYVGAHSTCKKIRLACAGPSELQARTL